MNLATLTKNVKKGKPFDFSVGSKHYRLMRIEKPKLSKTKAKKFETYTPTKEEIKAIERGRREIKNGEYISLEEFKNELGIKS